MSWAVSPTLEPYRSAISMMLSRMADDGVVERLWRRDASLWHPSADTQARIRQRLDWLDLPQPLAPAVKVWLHELCQDRSAQIVYVATGSAAALARLWDRDAAMNVHGPRLVLLDTLDPDQAMTTLARLDLQRSVFLFAATELAPEITALSQFVMHHLKRAGSFRPEQLALITTPLSPFDAWFRERADGRQIVLPHGVTECFGALSPLGLVPALLHGHDLAQLQDGAERMRSACRVDHNLALNPGVWLGTVLGVLAQHGRDKLTLLAPPALLPVAEWIATFVAGSLSKHRRGFVPIVDEPWCAASHSSDRIFVQLASGTASDAVLDAHVRSLEVAGQPVLHFKLADDAALAASLAQWEVAIAVAGMIIGVNPFDEPDTGAMRRVIERRLLGVQAPRPAGLAVDDRELRQALRQLLLKHPKLSYVVLASYFALTAQQSAALNTLRAALAAHGFPSTIVQPLRDTPAATQLLHAGRPNGAIIALATTTKAKHGDDTSGHALHDLWDIRLQADLAAWTRMQRAFLHLDLGSSIVDGLAACTSALQGML